MLLAKDNVHDGVSREMLYAAGAVTVAGSTLSFCAQQSAAAADGVGGAFALGWGIFEGGVQRCWWAFPVDGGGVRSGWFW
ncbi:dispersed gene family protein 1 (DGF-1), putative [Trypanosoma cruzi marinkellei]|uniref:Dispersed gene family protein 1 (DGF-1), putative n=1 Tax=Trypanosoma cruzi marinkellei TaxID=85056 RepID=K2N2Q8_TRYCR|nr:dispersed gene family protein 1 (DGF-1), putative [Trypanosoma cruzi marinkellei]